MVVSCCEGAGDQTQVVWNTSKWSLLLRLLSRPQLGWTLFTYVCVWVVWLCSVILCMCVWVWVCSVNLCVCVCVRVWLCSVNLCVCVCMWLCSVPQCLGRDQRSLLGSQCFPVILWDPGLALRSSDLCASAFTHYWSISLALTMFRKEGLYKLVSDFAPM